MRSLRTHVCLLYITAIFSAAPLGAQTASRYAEAPAADRHAAGIVFARLLVQAMMDESGTPGVSVAVGIDREIVWSEGFGFADVENRVPVWEETKFRIGSVSKPLTAAALGLLYEQGRLDLDAPVQRYVPSFPEKRWPISTRQVAGHLAGIRHYRDQEFLSADRYETVLDGLEIFKDDTLLFEPGTRFSYSSYGWNLLSAVVEGASGESFLSYMQENVFDPIGMHHTVADHTDSIIPQRTRFYERRDDGQVVNAPYVDNSYKWAGGGYLSTPEDLVRFGMAHVGEDFLRAQTVAELWTSQLTNEGEPTGYGIGWSVASAEGRVTEAAHGGGSIGGTTILLCLPEQEACIAIVGNLSQAPTSSPARLILDAFLDPAVLAADGSGPDISGSYSCSASGAGDEVVTASAQIGGTPAEYWGRFQWSNGTEDRIIFSASRADQTWLITVDEAGRLTSIRFTEIEDEGLGGAWVSGGSGSVRCQAS